MTSAECFQKAPRRGQSLIIGLNPLAALDEALLAARFSCGLPSFLRHPLTTGQARAILQRRLERQSGDFLAHVDDAVYRNQASPYRQLLQLAGCEYGDLVNLVTQDGLEAALRTLLRQGVYLTLDEFKGRQPAVRGSGLVVVNPRSFQNPATAGLVPAGTGGSRGAGTAVPINFAHIRDRAVNTLLTLDARGGAGWVKAHWHVPGGGVLARLLEFSGFGSPVARWFSQVRPTSPGLHPRYRWSARVLRWGSLVAGVPLPSPEYVPLEDPLPIAHWLRSAVSAGATPHLFAFASSAVRLCQAAIEAGIDLSGAQLTVTGEPLTTPRLQLIRRSGAEAVPRYAITECGAIGFGCLAPTESDDVHFVADLHALVQPDPDAQSSPVPPSTLFLTSLRPTAPFILINVAMGDQAEVVQRSCGCPLETLGWKTHLHTIRSYEKLTAGGMTFLDADVVPVLEEVLPARFGGGPTDYQLLEDEAEDGRPRLRLLVHPAVGPLDVDAVADAFLDAIEVGPALQKVMARVWREGRLLDVERSSPRITAAGKILHLHSERHRVSSASMAV